MPDKGVVPHASHPRHRAAITVKSGSKATLPTAVMAGAGPPSTTTLLATRKVVDGRPAPAMTRIATVALLADCRVRSLDLSYAAIAQTGLVSVASWTPM